MIFQFIKGFSVIELTFLSTQNILFTPIVNPRPSSIMNHIKNSSMTVEGVSTRLRSSTIKKQSQDQPGKSLASQMNAIQVSEDQNQESLLMISQEQSLYEEKKKKKKDKASILRNKKTKPVKKSEIKQKQKTKSKPKSTPKKRISILQPLRQPIIIDSESDEEFQQQPTQASLSNRQPSSHQSSRTNSNPTSIAQQTYPIFNSQPVSFPNHFAETIIIPDDGEELPMSNQEQMKKKWCLEKNRTFLVKQLTKQQLEKHDRCPICYAAFVKDDKGQDQAEKTEKRESNLYKESEHKHEHKMQQQAQQTLIQLLQLFCKHIFHKECISNWLLNQKPLCPCCRKDFRQHQEYKKWETQFQTIPVDDHLDSQSINMQQFFTLQQPQIIEIQSSEELIPSDQVQENEDREVFEIPMPNRESATHEFFLPGWKQEKQVQMHPE